MSASPPTHLLRGEPVSGFERYRLPLLAQFNPFSQPEGGIERSPHTCCAVSILSSSIPSAENPCCRTPSVDSGTAADSPTFSDVEDRLHRSSIGSYEKEKNAKILPMSNKIVRNLVHLWQSESVFGENGISQRSYTHLIYTTLKLIAPLLSGEYLAILGIRN